MKITVTVGRLLALLFVEKLEKLAAAAGTANRGDPGTTVTGIQDFGLFVR